MQLSSKRILYVSFGAFCIGFVVAIFSGGTPLERPLGLFLGGLVMFWIFYFPLIILKFIYRKFFPHSKGAKKELDVKKVTTNDSPSELTQKESNQDSKNDTLFDDI